MVSPLKGKIKARQARDTVDRGGYTQKKDI